MKGDKKRINASFEMGGLKMNFTKQIADGLLLNTLKRVKVQLIGPADKQLLFSKIFERIVLDKMAISIIDMFKIAGPATWQLIAARTGRVSMLVFIGFTETDKLTKKPGLLPLYLGILKLILYIELHWQKV